MKDKNAVLIPFEEKHIEVCLKIFDSNCPPFFDSSERILFSNFLKSLVSGVPSRETIQQNFFYVLELDNQIIGCSGFYLQVNSKEIRFSWGMIQREFHKKGFGSILVEYRINEILKLFPEYSVALDTSQHTFPFYEKLGFRVIDEVKNGYAPGLDKYEMLLN